MTENIPIKEIPLPNYDTYKEDLCTHYNISVPLSPIPFNPSGNLKQIPAPLNKQKRGWPWTIESQIKSFKNNEALKLSVVIPSYQQGIYIEESIRSILLQNYPNIELIVMDGGSTDSTISVLEYYKDFISIYVSEKDRGQAHALNKGFSLASGEIYYWVNSDDYLNINSLNTVLTHFIHNPKLEIIYGDGFTYDEQSQKLSYSYAPWAADRYLRFGSSILSHSVVWKSKVHSALWEDLNCAMDAELWLRLFNNRKTKHCHFPIGTLRVHQDQKTSDMKVWSVKWKEDYEVFIWKWYPVISPIEWKWRTIEYRFIQKAFRLFTAKSKLKKYLSRQT